MQWRVDDTDPPECKTGKPLPKETVASMLEMEIFNAPALVKKLSSGVCSLSRSDAVLCCAIARAAYDEGVKEALRAAQKLKVVL